MWLARPYPVSELSAANAAIQAASRGDVRGLQALYQRAAQALSALDPDEAEIWREEHPDAEKSDKRALDAVRAASDAWEGVVCIGSRIAEPGRFRAFTWMCAQLRFDLGRSTSPERFTHFARGGGLHDTSPEDAALYVALPALIGLGPEFPDELPDECPLPGEAVRALLGLPEADWDGVDPIDGIAVSAEAVRAGYAGSSGAWRALLGRCTESGLVVRKG